MPPASLFAAFDARAAAAFRFIHPPMPMDHIDSFSPSEMQQDIPHAVDAERAVLGALLLNNDLFGDATAALKEDFFYDKRHRLIYGNMLDLYDSGHVDPLTLAARLRDSNMLADAGGEPYLADLADLGAAPVNMRAYAELIADKAFLRSLINAQNDGISEGHNPGGRTPQQLLDAAEARLSQIGDTFRRSASSISTVSKVTRDYEHKIFDNYKNMKALHGVHPGFESLYNKTLGLNKGDLVILAGRPGAGKTAFGLNLLHNITKDQDASALCFSLEMSAEQLVMRLLGQHGLDMHKMRRANEVSSSTLTQLASASSKVENLNIHIDDSGTLNILEARTRARRIKREMEKAGTPLRLIMVDYLQLMDAPASAGRYDSRALEVSVISRGLKALAKELGVPVLALSQMNRGAERRPDSRPLLSDLRESGAIEQDADLILFLHEKNKDQEQADGKPAAVELIIGKQRNGPIGTIHMEFDKRLSLFSEAAPAHYADGGGGDGY